MNQTPHPLPLIARQHLVEQVLERLQRPDDVRDSPKRFIQPGFYGLGGVGKSRLLAEIEQRAKEVTPYVVSINFDRRHAAVVPGSPLALVQHLIAALADIDRQMCRPWQRWRWSSVNPFRECLDITGEMGEPSIIQSVVAREGSQVSDVTMTIEDRYAAVPPNLQQAFAQAFPDLCVKSKVRREYGAVGKPKPRPLVVILLDTLEAASKSLRAWLPNNLAALFSANTLGYHAVIVAAGRQQVPGLTDTPLPPFSPAEAVTFLRQYIVHRQNAGDTRYGSTVTQHNLREDTPVQRQVIELAEGVPLLLQLLADLAAAAPGKSLGLPTDTVPAAVEARITYVIEHYLKRMKAEAEAQGDAALWQRYWLLSCGAIARRIPSGGLLQALLQDLPGTPFDVRSNYDSLFQRLGQEAFVQIGPSDDLIYHELVREGFLAALRREDVQRWQELHRRAAGWFQAQGEETEALYHGVQRDYVGTMQTLRQRIEAALQAQAWQEAQGLIGTTTEIVLEADDWAWMMLYKAELAWGEDNQALAQQRLHRLIGQELPADLQERMAARLETWFGFNETMDAEEAAEKHSQRLHILLWWASRRSLKGVQAHALRGLGQVALRQTRYVDAQNHFAAALEMYKAIEDRRGQAQALHGLGDMAGMQARYVDAQNHYAAALVMYKAIEDRRGQAQALHGLGGVARMQARSADAQNHYAAALELFEAIADRLGQAHALLGLAEVAMMQARYADAQNHYAAALAVFEAFADRLGQAHALLGLGKVARMQARYADAQNHYAAALDMSEAIADRMGQAQALLGLGEVARMQARSADAQNHYAAALEVCEAIADRMGQAHALLGLGEVAMMQARYADAQNHYAAALVMYKAIAYRPGQAQALLGLGEVARMQDRYADAQNHYAAALAVFEAIAYRPGQARALLGLAEVAMMQARYADAQNHYAAALDVSEAIADRLGQAHALLGLGDVARMQARYAEARGQLGQALELACAIGVHTSGLSWCVVIGRRTLDQAEQHRVAGDRGRFRQAYELAQYLHGWGQRLMVEAPHPETTTEFVTGLQALGLRLSEVGSDME